MAPAKGTRKAVVAASEVASARVMATPTLTATAAKPEAKAIGDRGNNGTRTSERGSVADSTASARNPARIRLGRGAPTVPRRLVTRRPLRAARKAHLRRTRQVTGKVGAAARRRRRTPTRPREARARPPHRASQHLARHQMPPRRRRTSAQPRRASASPPHRTSRRQTGPELPLNQKPHQRLQPRRRLK